MFFVQTAYASCPVCVVTVGGGLMLAQQLGIDDLLVSIWISGLNSAVAFWVASKIKHRWAGNPVLWSVSFYILTLLYLHYTQQLWHVGSVLWGFDKVILGMTIGLLVFFIGIFLDKLVRYKNNKKVLFHYQKVIIPVMALILSTVFFAFFV